MREGVFEIYRDDQQVGTEEYHTWSSPTGDTLIALSVSTYDLDGDPDSSEYSKQTLELTQTLDQLPLYFQVIENSEGVIFTGSASFRDTLVQIYQEGENGGRAWTLVVPEGKKFVLDPGTYQLLEFLLGSFAQRGIAKRTHQVFVLRTRKVISVNLTRLGEENIEWPEGQTTGAIVAELSDGITAFKGWFDEEGRLLILDAPSYRTRVVRRAP